MCSFQKLALVESACDDPDLELEPEPISSSSSSAMGRHRHGDSDGDSRNGLCQTIKLKPGVPFSGITPSMWPPPPPTSMGKRKGRDSETDEGGDEDDPILYDELGFRLEKPVIADDGEVEDEAGEDAEEGAPQEGSSGLRSSPVNRARARVPAPVWALRSNNSIPFEEDDSVR